MDKNLFEHILSAHSVGKINAFTPKEIKQIRKDLDLSQKQFSKLICIDLSKLKAWERGNKKPTERECILVDLFLKNEERINWGNLVTRDLDEFILKNTQTEVRNRYKKAKNHYFKSLKLFFLDPEMAFIRLVAAQEELTVGIFKTLALNKFSNVEFTKNFTNHNVKTALSAIITFFVDILQNMSLDGEPGGLNLKINNEKIELIISIGDKCLNSPTPGYFEIYKEHQSQLELLDALYEDFLSRIPNRNPEEFIKQRAQSRNKIFYSFDDESYNLADMEPILKTFQAELTNLCWTLAILNDKNIPSNNYKIIGTMILVYKKILTEAKVLKKNS